MRNSVYVSAIAMASAICLPAASYAGTTDIGKTAHDYLVELSDDVKGIGARTAHTQG